MDSFLKPKEPTCFGCYNQPKHVFFSSKKTRKFFSKLLLIFIFCCLNSNHLAQAGEFSVSPMIIHINGESGKKQQFEFSVHAKSSGTVTFEIHKLKQVHSGHMEFLPLNQDDTGLVKWITLDTNKLSLKDNEKQVVQGQLNIPSRMRGSHLAAIMIKEVLPNNTKKMIVTIRYAVIIDLKLATQRGRLKAHLAPLRIEQREEGNYIVTDFRNLSNRPEELESTVDIRNENQLLIERITLLTESAEQKKESTSRVFPETTVGLKGLISMPLKSGTLSLSARSRFGRSHLPRERVEIEFSKEPAAIGLDYKLAAITIEPTNSSFSKNQFLASNPYTKTIKLHFPSSPKTGSGKFLFRPRLVTLAPGESHKIMLTQHWGDEIISARSFLIDLAVGHKWHEIKLQTVLKND